MNFRTSDTNGQGEQNPHLSRLSILYAEMLEATPEHGDVAVTNTDLGWHISAHRGGQVIIAESGKRGTARHMFPVSKEKVIQLWKMLIDGQIEKLQAEPWKPGYQINPPDRRILNSAAPRQAQSEDAEPVRATEELKLPLYVDQWLL